MEALFLLCRTQLGCLEAALKELDKASRGVARVREKWESVSSGTPSQVFNENMVRLGRAGVAPRHGFGLLPWCARCGRVSK